MRVLDLSHNLIGEEGMGEMVKAMKVNKVVTNVDMRENPGYSKEVRRVAGMWLMRNIEIMKRKNQTVEGKNWLNVETLLPKNQKPGSM